MKNIIKEDLSDGVVLNLFKHRVLETPTEQHMIQFLKILKDSELILKPFPITISCKNGTNYIPLFTRQEDIPEVLSDISEAYIQIDRCMEIMEERGVDGIVLDPYTEAFFLNRELCEYIKCFPSLAEELR